MPVSHPARYTGPAVALHWLLAVALIASFGVGLFMSDLAASPLKLRLYHWHELAGVTILALSALRLAWRLVHRPPPNMAVAGWQQRAATLTRCLMYGQLGSTALARR